MLRPLKVEIEAVKARLEAGAADSESLAYEIIQLVEQLRGERETFTLALRLSPGVFVGYGPYATAAAAMKAMPKTPMAQVAERGFVVATHGVAWPAAQLAKADTEQADRGDFTIVREDAALFRKGWAGDMKTRKAFADALTT